MSTVTLEAIEAKHAEIAGLIEKFKRQSATTVLRIAAVEIAMRHGEWYAGAVLNDDSSVKHHVIVAASNNDGRKFDGAQAWAADQGYSAPTIQEARLIVTHKGSRLDGMSWFWTSETHSNPACAWYCNLGYGGVLNGDRGAGGGAVAVRRLIP